MIYITHLLVKEPEKLAGPLLANTHVILLKGRNAWYGHPKIPAPILKPI
jgi:glycerol-3-phosphate dehydrogenase (NAD+)